MTPSCASRLGPLTISPASPTRASAGCCAPMRVGASCAGPARVRSRRAARTPTRHAKVCLNAAVAFLAFLAARQRDLANCTQGDVDDWLAEGPPSAPRVRDFLEWAGDRKLTGRFIVPGQPRRGGPVADDAERWATARRLLHDEGLELGDRVAGTLVLVYGQQLSRIVALTRDQVEMSSGGTRCTSAPRRSRYPAPRRPPRPPGQRAPAL